MTEPTPKEMAAEGYKAMTTVLKKVAEASEALKELKTVDLLKMLSDSAAAGTDFYGHQEILSRIGAGRLTDQQVEAARCAGFRHAFPTMVGPFYAGKLFGCQGLDFLSVMLLTEGEIEADLRTWLRVEEAAGVLGESIEDIRQFAATRIVIPFKHRRAFFDGGSLKGAGTLPHGHRQAWDRWRSAFIAATDQWGNA